MRVTLLFLLVLGILGLSTLAHGKPGAHQMAKNFRTKHGLELATNTSWLPYNIYFRTEAFGTQQGGGDVVINIYHPTGPETVKALSIDAELVFHPVPGGEVFNEDMLYLCSAAVVFVQQTQQNAPQINPLEPQNVNDYPIPHQLPAPPLGPYPLYPSQDDVFWGETYLIRDLKKTYKFKWSSLNDPRWQNQMIVLGQPLQLRIAYALPDDINGRQPNTNPFVNPCGGFDIIGTMNYAYKFP